MVVKLGTRGSQLALTQSKLVQSALSHLQPGLKVDLIELKTHGDRKQGTKAASQTDKKDWIYELECAVVANEIDFAVHSGKDIPAEIHPDTALLPILERATPYDAFIGQLNTKTGQRLLFKELQQGATVGTASLRRKAELLKLRPDLNIVEHRGNVPTRIEKLDQNANLSGIILASAGLERLSMQDISYQILSSDEMMPAVNQGILVAQFHKNNSAIKMQLEKLVDPLVFAEWQAERTVAEILEGDCKSAISIFAIANRDQVTISARVMSHTHPECVMQSERGPIQEARALGIKVGERLLAKGAANILAASSAAK